MKAEKRTPPGATDGGASNAKPSAAAREFKLPEPKPWPEPVGGASLLDDLVAVFGRYLALTEDAAETLALWVLFTHTFGAWTVSPRLALTSPVLRCGKTTALSILGCLVPRPLLASNVTPAVVFRIIERDRPTLLIDEADTFLDQHSEFRGILNSGHTRPAAYVLRCHGDNHEPRGFSTWAPIAVAKIGSLPDTLHDRSIEIRMRRRRRDERVERFRPDRTADLAQLARKAVRWAADNLEALRKADPELPGTLHDRAADNWRPLIAIADLVGDHWPETARKVALLLSGDATGDASIAVQLLAHIYEIFEQRGVDRLSSEELRKTLTGMEDRPWGDWKNWGLNKRQLAALLKPFDIKPRGIRIGEDTPRGYMRTDFEDAFACYLPPESATPQQPNEINELEDPSPATGGDDVADK